MDYLQKINDISKKLMSINETEKAEEIMNLKKSGSTGSEILMSVTHELLIYTREDLQIFKSIGSDVTELKNYCHSIGLLVY